MKRPRLISPHFGGYLFGIAYQNADKTIPHQNPIRLNAKGAVLLYGADINEVRDINNQIVNLPLDDGYCYFVDKYGKPLANGKVYTYFYQSTVLKESFDNNGQLNTNPIILDDDGKAQINIDGNYRLRVYDKNGVCMGDDDDLNVALPQLPPPPPPHDGGTPIITDLPPLDDDNGTPNQPPNDDGTPPPADDDDNGDIEIVPPPPPPPDEFAGFTHTEQRVGFFSTRKFREDDWVNYLKNGTVPTRYNRYDYSIYTDPFILKLTFREMVGEMVKYLMALLPNGLQERKRQNPNIVFADTEPYLLIKLPTSQTIYYAQDDFLGFINKEWDLARFKAIKPPQSFDSEIDFEIKPTTYYNANTQKFWEDYIINNFYPLTIRNRETIGVVGKKTEVGTNAPSEYFKLNSEITKDGQHTFEVAIFKKCVAIETESDGTRKIYPAGNVTVSAPVYLNMISLIAKRNSENYFDIFPKNLIENGVNYA